MDNEFEKIIPWNGASDTGRDVRLKLERNFSKIGLNFDEVVRKLADADDLFALIAEEIEKKLSKVEPDTSQELITFLKGLLIGNNGSGITVLENGTTQAVVDYLYVKVKAIFDELDVKKKTYVGGEQVISHAGMKCIRVEELPDAYRCHFKAEEDGVEINNEFTVGSLAIAQECNIKTGVSQHTGNRYYWRAVTAVGADYIDLSKADCDPNVENDIPVAGDDIVGLGHKTDITRQAAIILSSVGEVSPSILMYQGINGFTLADKEVIAFDFDKATGKAGMRVYGDAYIGARDKSSYLAYTEEGLEVKAKKILLGTGNTLDDTLATINDSLDTVSGQLDRSFQIWQGETAATPTLSNEPASGWKTDSERSEHVEDFYITTEGLCYRFVLEEGAYRWKPVADKYLVAYVQQIGEKKRVFVAQPTDATAYDVGDCWVNATYRADGTGYDNDRLVCVTAKAAGAPFSISHWRKDSGYTDDTAVDEQKEKLLDTGIDIDNKTITATADKFTIQGRDGKRYAVFEIDGDTGLPVARMTGTLIAKSILAGGMNIDNKFVVSVADGKTSVKVTGEIEATGGSFSGKLVTKIKRVEDSDASFYDGDYTLRDELNLIVDTHNGEGGGASIVLPSSGEKYIGAHVYLVNACLPPYTRALGSIRYSSVRTEDHKPFIGVAISGESIIDYQGAEKIEWIAGIVELMGIAGDTVGDSGIVEIQHVRWCVTGIRCGDYHLS